MFDNNKDPLSLEFALKSGDFGTVQKRFSVLDDLENAGTDDLVTPTKKPRKTKTPQK